MRAAHPNLGFPWHADCLVTPKLSCVYGTGKTTGRQISALASEFSGLERSGPENSRSIRTVSGVDAGRMTATLPSTEITALLGRGTRFEGKLQFEGRVRIDGAFKGEIRSDDVLIIGDGAEVDADIEV